MRYQIGPAFRITLFMTVLTGLIYPGIVTGFCQLLFPHRANGSMVEVGGKVAGSELIGQNFSKPQYFHPRPSAVGYNAAGSGASNQGYTSAQLKKDVAQRTTDWRKANATDEVPPDMIAASASGLDPDISPRAAELQVPRVAAARRLSARGTDALMALVKSHEQGPQWGFLGEPRVNVLALNLALDEAFPEVKP